MNLLIRPHAALEVTSDLTFGFPVSDWATWLRIIVVHGFQFAGLIGGKLKLFASSPLRRSTSLNLLKVALSNQVTTEMNKSGCPSLLKSPQAAENALFKSLARLPIRPAFIRVKVPSRLLW